MADTVGNIPQYEDEQPVFQPIAVQSEAEGDEAFAKTLGALGEQAANIGTTMEDTASKAMYMQSVANAAQVKTRAKMQMDMNPGQAASIATTTNDTLDAIGKNAYVNNADRGKLNVYLNDQKDDVSLAGVQNVVKQNQLATGFTIFQNAQDQIKAYTQTVASGDMDRAQQMHDAMIDQLKGAVQMRAITPEQAGTIMKTMGHASQSAINMHNGYATGNMTAEQYNAQQANPLSNNDDNSANPINTNTGYLVDTINQDKSMQGMKSSIANGMNPNVEAYFSASNNDQLAVNQWIAGMQNAKGLINSAAPYPQVVGRYNELNQKNEVLTHSESMEKDVLGKYVNDIKSGNYLQVMQATPAGNAITKDFNARNAAIESMAIDDQSKQQMLLQNKNKMIDSMVSLGQAQHIPNQYIKPIPLTDINAAQSAFNIGGDPAALTRTLGSYNKSSQMYVASSLATPLQRMVAQGVILAPSDTKPSDLNAFVLANQTGVRGATTSATTSAITKPLALEANKDGALITKVYKDLSDQMKVVGNSVDMGARGDTQLAMANATVNYAKFLATQANDASNVTDYLPQAERIYKGAFSTMSGSNYSVNPSYLPTPITSSQMDKLSDYVNYMGYLRANKTSSVAQQMTGNSRNPLRMVIDAHGNVQSVDGNGNNYYSMPFSQGMLAAAERHYQLKKVVEVPRAERIG